MLAKSRQRTIYMRTIEQKTFFPTVKSEVLRHPLQSPQSISVSFTAPVCGDINAKLRFARIPKRKDIDPENSFMGMNIFQQQTWYHSYQLPIFAKAGFRWIRPWLAWENVWSKQETTKGNLNLKYLDTQLRRLKLHGQALKYMFYSFPAWLVGKNASNDRVALDENQLQEWEKHVEANRRALLASSPDYEIWTNPISVPMDRFPRNSMPRLPSGICRSQTRNPTHVSTPSRMLAHWTGSRQRAIEMSQRPLTWLLSTGIQASRISISTSQSAS